MSEPVQKHNEHVPVNAPLVSAEKQFELMYIDAVQVSYETKRAIFDLTKWVVTLQGLIVGFAVLEDVKVSQLFVLAPLLVGLASFILLQGFQAELESHRRTLAALRHTIGDHVETIHADHINTYYHAKRKWFSYWTVIRNGHRMIVIGSTIVATVVVLDSATGILNLIEKL